MAEAEKANYHSLAPSKWRC